MAAEYTIRTVGTPNWKRFAETWAAILASELGATAVDVRYSLRDDLSTAARSPSFEREGKGVRA